MHEGVGWVYGEQERSVGAKICLCVWVTLHPCHCYIVNTLRITGLFPGACLFLLETTSVPLGRWVSTFSLTMWLFSTLHLQVSLLPVIIRLGGHSSGVFWISTLYLLKCIIKMDIPLKIPRKYKKHVKIPILEKDSVNSLLALNLPNIYC